MFDNIIAYSVKNKFIIGLFVAALIVWGLFSLKQLPIEAVPDITNNQVQIITISPTLATQEVEQFITTPIELAVQSLQKTEEIRSISRFGLSVVTVVFEENYDIYLARQLVNEKLKEAEEDIPTGLGTPEMAPLSTGLGEIYQYVVRPEEGLEDKYSPTELRSIQDWIVTRQLLGIEGVAEVNSMGGYLKQYEVAVNPNLLKSVGISISDIFNALEKSNENTGGAYIEKNSNAYYIRSEGLAKSLDDIGNIVVNDNQNIPVLVKDVATVQYGKAPRYGALVRDGKEVVGGKVMMFKGANSAQVTELVKERVIQIQKSLPDGVVIEPYLVRDKLISTAIGTVKKNLIEGGLIVIFILVLLLGNWRAGLIVASVIPLAMLFAVSMMNLLGISANLMSLGAIDFGLIVDGAVIIVEAIVHRLQVKKAGSLLSQTEMDSEVIASSQKIRSSAAFGEIIILMVYIPILALVGIEGKMFKPMAQTVMLAIAGALVLSLTYVPMMAALVLKKKVVNKETIADKIIAFFQRGYTPILNAALRFKIVFVSATVIAFLISLFVFSRMGGEFIPTLEEGDLAMQHILPPGSSLHNIPGVGFEFSQPIQLRFNELMTGSKADIAIKLFGEDLDVLYQNATKAENVIKQIDGVGTVNVEQTIGMPQVMVKYDYQRMAQYGLHIQEVNQVIRSAFAGEKAGIIYEGEKRFDLVISIAVPMALALIFILLYFTFGSVSQAALIFTAIPLSAIGGIWALELRGLPFSISAGIGFIALFGVAVLNGIVLIGYFNQLKKEGMKNIKERITTGTRVRLRPVIMTAAVASLGFLPMAISISGGAEVQRPLATVVIGGLITATFLTLIILPILYYWLEKWSERKSNRINVSKGGVLGILLILGLSFSAHAQEQALDLDSAISMAITNHPNLKAASLEVEKNKSLQSLKYNLGTTDISYQGDGLIDRQFGQQVNQIGVVQNFTSPGITKAQNELQDAYTNQSITHQQIYSNLSSAYKDYHRKATVRVQAGAANRIELLTLQSKWNEYELLLNQVKIEITNLNKRFQLLLNSKELITTADSLSVAHYSTQIDTTTNPLLLQHQQEIAIENAKVNAMEADLKPSFNAGYALQKFNQGGWLSAVQLGVSLPLFNGQAKKRIEAQKMQIEIGNYKYQSTLLSFKQDQLEIQNTLNLYQAGVDFYKNQIETINPEIIRISELNYQAGEISYLELLNTLQLMTTNNKNYWEQIIAFNKAVADFQFLTNQ